MRICPICDSTKVRLSKRRDITRPLVPADLQITDAHYGNTLELWKCADCTFLFAAGPEMELLSSLYEKLSDPEYEEGLETRSIQMQWLLEVGIAARPHPGNLLEIGSGIGILVAKARALGIDAIGVEPSKGLVAAARRINGVDLIQGAFPHPLIQGRQFDLVYAVDVIEHVADPAGFLVACAEALAPGGCLVVVTPDIGSITARLMRHRWWHFRLAHVGYFSRRSMVVAARRAGLTIVKERRAIWFFPVHYLAARLAIYLPPLRFLGRCVKGSNLITSLGQRTVRLNLRDSAIYFMQRSPLPNGSQARSRARS